MVITVITLIARKGLRASSTTYTTILICLIRLSEPLQEQRRHGNKGELLIVWQPRLCPYKLCLTSFSALPSTIECWGTFMLGQKMGLQSVCMLTEQHAR